MMELWLQEMIMLLMPEPTQEITITEEPVPTPMTRAQLVVIREQGLVPITILYPPVAEVHQQLQVIQDHHNPVTELAVHQIPVADTLQE